MFFQFNDAPIHSPITLFIIIFIFFLPIETAIISMLAATSQIVSPATVLASFLQIFCITILCISADCESLVFLRRAADVWLRWMYSCYMSSLFFDVLYENYPLAFCNYASIPSPCNICCVSGSGSPSNTLPNACSHFISAQLVRIIFTSHTSAPSLLCREASIPFSVVNFTFTESSMRNVLRRLHSTAQQPKLHLNVHIRKADQLILASKDTTSRLALLCFVPETFDTNTKLVFLVFFNSLLHPCHPPVAYGTKISQGSRNDYFFGVVLMLHFRSLIHDAARLLGSSMFSSSGTVTGLLSAKHTSHSLTSLLDQNTSLRLTTRLNNNEYSALPLEFFFHSNFLRLFSLFQLCKYNCH
ncbi:uncharacterized protein MONOS_6627 [Monocercomonoides exilis]|uniref:uncharacterized protein n=1 Tax=Monocercomonoides exilis TaxID=2049356 RepID=UPI00355A4B2B|nr:hypothetical protein MONOS_6627 [Monocercomonoides exilis]|eukprot:MONOS_6627.1-p1 / transcript=MONOS_6627.1 / gene=MONOS_6627 / organism=Monocercomonoides_exilis_PA203 / gene_product=unspecified product / transcript_product=unspecified product / location=Mono_scaffold00212:17360-18430(+) / protein_length=357 / sequence_SO=supercontig / SO=protein_coding / is_pseudo=false